MAKHSKLKLNSKKILSMLMKMDRDIPWLVRKSGCGRQYIYYWLREQCPQGAKPIAAVLGCDFRELLI
jgi:hypothetical protein